MAALDEPTASLDLFLASVTTDDPELGIELRALLAAHGANGRMDWLAAALGGSADPSGSDRLPDPSPATIGPWALVSSLGQGGIA